MQVKVCGVKDPSSAAALSEESRVNYLGLIFYPPSPRSLSAEEAKVVAAKAPEKRWVGVFVDESPVQISSLARFLSLAAVQLHGSESVQDIDLLREELSGETEIWKAIRVGAEIDPELVHGYEASVDALLFDTGKPGVAGGSGEKFSWPLLERLQMEKPYFLSGGIGPSDVQEVRSFAERNSGLRGVDVNSCFEVEPGVKDTNQIRLFLDGLTQ